jgi:hypothetical protein
MRQAFGADHGCEPLVATARVSAPPFQSYGVREGPGVFMTRKVRMVFAAVLVLAVVSGVNALVMRFLFPTFAQAQSSGNANHSGYLRRYAANFTAYGFELATNVAPAPGGQGGTVIYNKNFFTADDINTLT